MSWYKAGTVTVTNNSPSVIGAGTTWSNGAVASGAAFSLIDTSGAAIAPFYEVLSVTDDTHITLKTPYGGTTVNGAQYALWNLAGEQTTPYLAAAVSELVRKCKNVEQNASTASSDAQRAETARSAAETARDTAVAAKDVAVTAKTSAETSAQNAAASETAALLGLSGATVFKGTLGTGGTITALPTADYLRGWTYKIITAGMYAGVDYALGDLIIALSSFNTEFKNSDWIPVHIADEMNLKADVTYVDAELALKANIADVDDALALKADAGDVADALALKADADAVINALESSVDENIPIFDGIAGDKLKDSGVKLSDKADVTAVTAGLLLKADITSLEIEKKLLMDEIDSLKKSAIENSNAPYLTASDYGAVALAKNSVGVGTVGVDGVTVTNLVNGDFETGYDPSFTVLGAVRSTEKAYTGIYSFKMTTGNNHVTVNFANLGFADGDQICAVGWAYKVDSGVSAFRWQNIVATPTNSTVNAWARHLYKRTYSAADINQYCSFFESGGICYWDSIQIINLTAHGLQDLTEAQLAKLLPVYFNGEKTFGGMGCLVSKDSAEVEVGRMYFSTDPMYSNATLRDILTYSEGEYYHTHNVDSDGNAIVEPYDTEVDTNGQFLALSEGTVTYEPWYPDIGIYTDKFTLTKAITAVKELYKYGSETPITDAVIVGDGLSFTSASLTAGDLAYGVFEFSEPLRPLMTIKSRNDDATVVDTVTGTVYTFRPVVTNGVVASWALTEV